MAERTYTVVYIDRRDESGSRKVVDIPCSGFDFWLKDDFWELRFFQAQPDDHGISTFFMKIAVGDLLQIVGRGEGTDG